MMKGVKTRFALLLLFGAGLSSLVHADQTFTVTTVADEVDEDLADLACITVSGQCSLRAAIQQSNAIDDGTTTIELPIANNYALTVLGDGEDGAATGDLDIHSRIIINGAGSDLVAIDGRFEDRIFDIKPTANLTLNDITIRNGHNQVDVVNQDLIEITEIGQLDGGGGIKVVDGALTLNRVNLSDNTAGGVGGGIDSRSSIVTINASLINDNRVAGFGGGISNMNGLLVINDTTISRNRNSSSPDLIFGGGIFNSGDVNSLEIHRSTISDNSAFRDGGGIYHQVGSLLITNSTISGNEAGRWGGGLYNSNATSLYKVELLHVTVTANEARGNVREISQIFEPTDPKGGGLYNRSQASGVGVLRLYNSLVVLNGDGGDCFNDVESFPAYPAFLDKVGTIVSDETCLNVGEAAPTVVLDSTIIGMWPLLGNNGGATQTHALLDSSIAINAAEGAFCPNHDQRKFGPRGISMCDSGAYEFGATDFGEPLVTPALPYIPPPPASSGNRAPQAFDLLIVVPADGAANAEVTAMDLDGDELQFSIFESGLPTKGTVSWNLNGTFTYEAFAGARGVDRFVFNVCDGVIDNPLCDQGVVNVVINDPLAEYSVIATIAPAEGVVSPVTVISESSLFATMSDPDFTYPLGAMFFDVTNVTPDVDKDTITVTLQLPASTTIAPGAVVRKMNKFGIWTTLSMTPNTTTSSAVFDPVAKTVTLTLHDNDIFDLNSSLGMISDPVALGVSAAAAAGTGEQGSTQGAATSGTTSEAASGGGGIASLGWLSALLLFGIWRRQRSLKLH